MNSVSDMVDLRLCLVLGSGRGEDINVPDHNPLPFSSGNLQLKEQELNLLEYKQSFFPKRSQPILQRKKIQKLGSTWSLLF